MTQNPYMTLTSKWDWKQRRNLALGQESILKCISHGNLGKMSLDIYLSCTLPTFSPFAHTVAYKGIFIFISLTPTMVYFKRWKSWDIISSSPYVHRYCMFKTVGVIWSRVLKNFYVSLSAKRMAITTWKLGILNHICYITMVVVACKPQACLIVIHDIWTLQWLQETYDIFSSWSIMYDCVS